MTIAKRINILITSIAVIAGLLFTAYIGIQEYRIQRDMIELRTQSIIESNASLPANLYFDDAEELTRILSSLLNVSPAISRTVFFSSTDSVIAAQHRPWADSARQPNLSKLRSSSSPLDIVWSTQEGGATAAHAQLISSISMGEKTLSLTLPVVSPTNPTTPGLSRTDFAAGMVDPSLVSSLFVSGFVEIAISRSALIATTFPVMMKTAIFGAVVAFICWLIGGVATRRITAPLGLMTKAADDIAAGRKTDPISLSGGGEVRQMGEILNGVIAGLANQAKQMDADRKILSMKVSERTEQLSEQREKLTQAQQNASEARNKLRHLAYFDSLTGLPNRRLFAEQLALLLRLATRNKDKVGLLFVDIDNFKRINDSLGIASGDELLRQIATRLQEGIRDSDVLHRNDETDASIMDLSRMGGDEFTVVLNKVTDAEAAQRVAQRLRQTISEPFLIDRQEIILAASIGISLAPEHSDDVESLLRCSRTAMLKAKKDGRNRAVLYDSSMESANRERLQLENDLRKALERNQLVLHYQPQVHARSGSVVGAEALVRWRHPDRGLVPPYQWIPLAEELGIIDDIGAWVLREACEALVSLRQKGLKLPKISVNVSALQFHDDFVETVSDTLRGTGLTPDCLELELTEGIIINDQETTVSRVQRLKDLGVRLSIDDFGTGYSSLSYLTRFPLDELKIDRSFVLGIAQGQQDVLLVGAIIAMAKSLDLDIVVEGVERVEELQFFREQEVHTIQGFLFSAPVPLEKLESLLEPQTFLSQIEIFDRRLGAPSIEIEQA